jgi:putative transposase
VRCVKKKKADSIGFRNYLNQRMSFADNSPSGKEGIMGKKRAELQEQPTIWEIPDDICPLIQTILAEHYPAKRKGHRRVDLRRVLNGVIFRLRTGCQWNQLPKQFGDDSTVHRHFQQWCQRGILARLWAVLVEACDALGGVDWQWQTADAAMGKARMGGDLVGRNPTDRGKKG